MVDVEKRSITRKMEEVLNGLDKKFQGMCNKSDFKRKLDALSAAGSQSNRHSILASLFAMFEVYGIPYEKDRENAYYEKLVQEAEIPTFLEMEDKIMYALYSEYANYPGPEQYMLRIVNKMSHKEDNWDSDTLRVRILKQFIKYGNYLADAGFGGKKVIQDYVREKIGKIPAEKEIADAVDDMIFGVLENAQKAQKKPEGKYGLLKLADDLAGGKFRVGGATKRGLYLFAMVFDMTYYAGPGGVEINADSDIERNLFRDYYTNNLMRFISDAYCGKLCEFETDPSGQGINYKNFAEMIYLYFISSDYKPDEKIKLASEMIERVQKSQYGKERREEAEEGQTVRYKKWFFRDSLEDIFCEDILRKPEDEFEQFICEHYDCNTWKTDVDGKRGYAVSEMQLAAEQNTAYQNYQEIIHGLEEMDNVIAECNYGLWITDVDAFKKKEYENVCDRNPHINREKFREFMDLLVAVNSFLETKTLYISDAAAMSRTSLLVAYYYYFNALHEADEDKKSFEELFHCFKRNVDELLENSYYQLLSGKNIFDVLLVFSSYAYLYY